MQALHRTKMAHLALIHAVFVLGVLRKGLTAQIETRPTVVEALGGEACFNCQLHQSKDVVQVTWQKMSPEGKRNLATFSKYFGSTVNSGFLGKVELKDAGLHNCSLVVKDLTEEDEGCYLCLFTIYPGGALTGRTCLQLYELHEPVLHVRESNSTDEAPVVSCSATGRPAPTVTLDVPLRDLGSSQYNTINNTNGTFTVTVTVSTTAVNGGAVGCAAQVLSGRREVSMTIPEVTRTPDLNEGSGGIYFIVIPIVVVVVVVAAASVVLLQKQKNSTNRNEMSVMRLAAVQDAPTGKTALVKQESDGIRQRITPPTTQQICRMDQQEDSSLKHNDPQRCRASTTTLRAQQNCTEP